MADDLIVLWRDHPAAHDVCYEIVQIGEGEFELRILCDGRLWLTEEASDFHELLDRASRVRADLHPLARKRATRGRAARRLRGRSRP